MSLISCIGISNFRSIRDAIVPLDRLNVVIGKNGSGKSNLLKAIKLITHVADGSLALRIALEGGLQSVFWAGSSTSSKISRHSNFIADGARSNRVQELRLGYATHELSFAMNLGYPIVDNTSMFSLDPEIKVESVWSGQIYSRSKLLTERRAGFVVTCSETGALARTALNLMPSESLINEFMDVRCAPEVHSVRAFLRSWRFYDQFRTEASAPARAPQIGSRTTTLDDAGSNLAAALRTIMEIGDYKALNDSIADAFPNSSLEVTESRGWFSFGLNQKGLMRPLNSAELSDGTLRYISILAALLSPRPPPLYVFNEPENSLHLELIEPLGRLFKLASRRSQIILATHSERLKQQLVDEAEGHLIHLKKSMGETLIATAKPTPSWNWPKR